MKTHLEYIGYAKGIPVWRKRNKGCSDKNLVTSSATLTEVTNLVQPPTKETINDTSSRQDQRRHGVA